MQENNVSDSIVVVGMARTPLGGMQGSLSDMTASDLGAKALAAALERSQVAAEDVSETIMGCVLPAGVGQAPARQASLGAGMPLSTGATTINKVCGSGMKAVMLGMDIIKAGSASVVAAGGMESMTNAPYLLPNARAGMRLGHGQVKDHMFLDGLEDAYDKGQLMGTFAEATAGKYEFSREDQDNYTIESVNRAKNAITEGKFAEEIVPVTIKTRKGEVTVDTDEQPGNAKVDKIPQLRPAFSKDGTVTAANSSSISDGAAAMILMSEVEAEKRGLKPIARLLAHQTFAHEPAWFTTAPVGAMTNVMKAAGWSVDDVDLFEINEAFAVVTMAAMHDLKLPHEKVNVNGGACALGHPIGASGARIMVTLIAALKEKGLKKGIASLCIGGGEATAIALEIV
jgi:acetyl-CoA C-acetyltransferase